MRRRCDFAIISDCHLGTPHCREAELHDYLQEIHPDRLIINGDLCDLGPYFTKHWPARHQAILRRIFELSDGGCDVIYVIGNHDAPMQRFADILPGITCCHQYRCEYQGRRWLFTHGHRFDKQLCSFPLIRKLGGLGYEFLQMVESRFNRALRQLRLPEASLVSTIKQLFPGARSFINRFQQSAIDLAHQEHVDVICCGHIHVPKAIDCYNQRRCITYLNSGDWVEHCTAIEAANGTFTLHQHLLDDIEPIPVQAPPIYEAIDIA